MKFCGVVAVFVLAIENSDRVTWPSRVVQQTAGVQAYSFLQVRDHLAL